MRGNIERSNATNEKRWKAERKLLSPTFTSGKIKMMTKPIVELSDKLIEHINTKISGNDAGEVVDMRPVFHAYSMDVIGLCAFGANFACLGKDNINRENTIFNSGLEIFTNLTITSAFQSYFFHFEFVPGKCHTSLNIEVIKHLSQITI